MRRSTRPVLPLVTLVVAAILLSLFVGEALFRALGHEPRKIALNPNFWITGWAAMDPELGWVNREGAFRSVEPGHALMTFTSDGRRADPTVSKAADTSKILVIGCSFTQGEGIADDESYPHVINGALPNHEVLNFGTGGYGTYQSLLRARSYFRSPHAATPLVIYGLQGHHMVRNVASADWVPFLTTRDGRYLVPPNVRQSGGQFIESPGHPVELWPLETQSALVASAHHSTLKAHDPPLSETVLVFHHLMQIMKNVVAGNGASLLVLGLIGVPVVEVEWMRQHGIDYVECGLPNFKAEYRVGGSGHPNGRANTWWGQCALKALAERGYVVSRADGSFRGPAADVRFASNSNPTSSVAPTKD